MQQKKQFKASDYLIMPKDIFIGIKKFFIVMKKSSWRSLIGLGLVIVLAIIMRVYFDFHIESIVFWLFFFILMFWNLDSRISIVIALGGLVIIPLLLYLGQRDILLTGEDWAENVAVWVYYFLVIGVVKQIWEFQKEKRTKKLLKIINHNKVQGKTSQLGLKESKNIKSWFIE